MKQCKYGCGTFVIWDEEKNFWVDAKTKELHSYKKCAEMLKSQGKEVNFFDQKNRKKKEK